MSKPWGLYARVSTKRQSDDGVSIESQLEQMHTASKQRGYVAREYVDRGKSAWRDDVNKRPAFKLMMDDVRTGELAGVMVTHLDRFSRKLLVQLQAFGELGNANAGLVCLENSSIDYSTPSGKLFMQQIGAFAEYYSNELSRKIKRGLSMRASQGFHNGLIPFGICNGKCVDCKGDKPTCKRWGTIAKGDGILHPDDAPGVVLAYETYKAKNVSFDKLADVMNAAGYRSRTPEGRVLWNRHSIAELLRNITYTGIVIHNGKEIPGKFPAIISRELFDEVQAIKHKRRFKSMTFSGKYRVYIFGSIIKCAGCGRVMQALAKGKKNKLQCYHCKSNLLKKVHCPKPSAWTREAELESQFAEIIKHFKLPDDWLARIDDLINSNGHKPRNTENDKATLIDRLERIKSQFEYGHIDEKEYLAKYNEIKRTLADCEPPAARMIVDAAKYLQSMTIVWGEATQEEKRDMVRAIFDWVICDPETNRLVALQPKAVFRPLLRQIHGLVENGEQFEIQNG